MTSLYEVVVVGLEDQDHESNAVNVCRSKIPDVASYIGLDEFLV
jgi:hypothetical protein